MMFDGYSSDTIHTGRLRRQADRGSLPNARTDAGSMHRSRQGGRAGDTLNPAGFRFLRAGRDRNQAHATRQQRCGRRIRYERNHFHCRLILFRL